MKVHPAIIAVFYFTLAGGSLTSAQEGGAIPGPFDQQAASIQAITLVGSDVVYAGSFGHGMFRSDDRGASWKKSGNGVTDPFILSLVTANDGSVYVGTFRGGAFRTKDQGVSWQAVNGGLKRKEIKTLLAVGEVIYAGTADGVYRLNAAGDHWTVVTTGLSDVLVHALAQSSDGTLYAGTSGKGVLRFKANTTGWVRMRKGLKDHEGMVENFVRVLTIDPDGSIYAGTFDGGVFRSTDGGTSWRPISRALPNDSIRGILFNARGLFVATGHGIFKTLDKGRQWVPLNKGLTSKSIQVLVESDAGSLYAGTNAGAFRSDDDGKTWVAINEGLEGGVAPPPFLFR
ncbi:ligand-binding sensor domain-containing protein [Petrachloros mirabilis]